MAPSLTTGNLLLQLHKPHVIISRQHHSTETTLLNILNDSYSNMYGGRSTLLVALDLSVAFDTVEHSVLLTRLHNSFA